MKKIIGILALTLSAAAFAQSDTVDQPLQNSNIENMPMQGNMGGMMQQMNNLTTEQQSEFNELHSKKIKENQKLMLDIQGLNLKIQREMSTDKPNQKKIDKLIDQKTKLQAQQQKDMMNFRIDMKEKFGIDMMGGMMKGMMSGSKGCQGMDKMGSNKMMNGMENGMMVNNSTESQDIQE